MSCQNHVGVSKHGQSNKMIHLINEVNNSKPYGDFEIIKKECVGHVQKRLGTRLRTLRTTLKGKILSDGKKISGRGRLTNKVINTMQNYYGMAIRQNVNDLFAMRKSVIATLMHNTNFDDAETRIGIAQKV